ncbi:MAG: tetratricopeptide repeat protein [Holophagaceae bacterium]|nr:tetratricopeptide repeat protein [Holophagaceae bacterium]
MQGPEIRWASAQQDYFNGDGAGALAHCRAVVEAIPGHGEAWHLGSVILHGSGQLEEALEWIGKAIALNPGSPVPLLHRALMLRETGEAEAARRAFEAVLEQEPMNFEAHYFLGLMAYDRNEGATAVDHLRKALAQSPDLADAHARLGALLDSANRTAEARWHFQKAAALLPGDAGAHFNLGEINRRMGHPAEAISAFQRAVDLDPAHSAALHNLGTLLRWEWRIQEALAVFEQAERLRPDPPTLNNHARLLKDLGRLDEALPRVKRAVELEPDSALMRSNYIYGLHFPDGPSNEMIAEAHRTWSAVHEAPTEPLAELPVRDPEKRLRVGFVSANFHRHSCAFFLEPLLSHYDRKAMEAVAYASVEVEDAVTDRFRGLVDLWRDVKDLEDKPLAELIRRDGVDILVDLGGHTGGNRLGAFAFKPAPLQVTWLGYPNTTGLSRMDLRISDAWADPEEGTTWHSEKVVRLPGGFLCYQPPSESPEIAETPMARRGYPTFGCFNALAKLSDSTLRVWAEVMRRVPEARLYLKTWAFGDEAAKRLVVQRLLDAGLPEERLMLSSWVEGDREHLSLYGQIDIALDPFPYNGTTTTCEAMWMGVPVITLEGDRHSARVGSSLLNQVGLRECIAASESEYVERAVLLGGDGERLKALRGSLRARMMGSPLCDGPAFADKFGRALRSAWVERCGTVG